MNIDMMTSKVVVKDHRQIKKNYLKRYILDPDHIEKVIDENAVELIACDITDYITANRND